MIAHPELPIKALLKTLQHNQRTWLEPDADPDFEVPKADVCSMS